METWNARNGSCQPHATQATLEADKKCLIHWGNHSRYADRKGTLARRVQDIGVSGIRHMMSLAAKESGVISLGQGVPDARTPLYIREGVIELLRENEFIGKYSLSAGLLNPERGRCAAAFGKGGLSGRRGQEYLHHRLSAIESLATAISSIVEVGDEVLLMDPGYPPYIEQVTFA